MSNLDYMIMKLGKIATSLIMLAASVPVMAQNVVLKTNIAADVLLSPAIGIETGLAAKWTLDVSGQVNAWNINSHRWRHWLVQPEARYWLCDSFQGHFFGVHALGGQFNVGNIKNSIKFLGTDFSSLSHFRHQGWMAGAGIAYGYAWILSRHWNLEAEIGMGWIFSRYDVYPCAECGTKSASGKTHNYVGPTKIALNLVYLF